MSKLSPGRWTDEQWAAITARGCNLLVSAAAGAGKTAVLVERILSRIKDSRSPVDIDRLLVVTFTNAAAAEMRERIAAAISAELSAGDDGGRLGLQLALLSRARISTIHSFCMDILKQYFYRLDMDPGFRPADETESMMLKADVFEELMEAKYEDMVDSGFKELVECYGGELDDRGLMDLVIRIYGFSRSNPDPELWLKKAAGRFDPGPGMEAALRRYASGVMAGVGRTLAGAAAEMEMALELCLKPGGPARYAPAIKEEIAMIRDLAVACAKGWDEACRSFRECRFAGLKSAGPGVDEGLKNLVADLRNRVKKKIKSLAEGCLSRPLADHAADMVKIAPLMGALAQLVSEFAESYRLAKLSRGLVDFSDLEHCCLQILAERGAGGELRPSAVALELREQFDEVLVDEYQDINPVQEAIINLVARPADRDPNLFMVGDVKQSIYRFRLAEPGLFMAKYRDYPVQVGGPCRRIDLSKNFRSRREIINAVNYIFRRIMTREAAEIDYDPGAELVYGAAVFSGEEKNAPRGRRAELLLLDRSRPTPEDGGAGEEEGPEKDAEDFSDREEPGAVQAEARLIAGRIRGLMDGRFTVWDDGLKAMRPVMYRDIVILLRTVRGWAGVFADELKNSGIPAYSEPDAGYFQAAEIETMVSLLKLVDNPRQDIPLAAVLRSPIVGLGAEELAAVRMFRKTGDLWDAVVCAAESAGGELAVKLSGFIASLNRWRELGRRAAMTDLIWTVYRETGFYHYAGAMPGGADRQANLRALHHWAGQYEATTFRGVFSFLRFIDRMREKGEDPGRARTLGENENVVRIMSIHKSKGLEFPVVIVAGLGKQFNLQDLHGNILLHRELGFGPSLVDPAARITYPTLPELAVRERLRREALAEEMRVLYVAMTRAREKLVLAGAAADLRRSARMWAGCAGRGLSTADILGARSYLDWICPALAGHGDGGPLRALDLGEEAAGRHDDRGREQEWVISISKMGDIDETAVFSRGGITGSALAGRIRRGEKVEAGGEYAGVVQQRLSWVYPHRGAVGKPAKISVTGLEEASGTAVPAVEKEAGDLAGGQNLWFLKPAYARPAFMSARKDLTPAEKGSAIHMVMRHLDLGGRLDAGGVLEQVGRMVEKELITEDQAAVVDCRRIAEFFLSGPGKRMLAASSVKREVPFSLAVPAGEIYPELGDSHSGERVLVQGVIDCLAEEGDGYLLIDYKTDRLNGRDPGQLAEKYRVQVDFYARAVESLTGRPVKERYLYFFELGMDFRV
ncbi:MAG: helicase-exonuclease AddAB subunit AddA [Bacillota bacterium]